MGLLLLAGVARETEGNARVVQVIDECAEHARPTCNHSADAPLRHVRVGDVLLHHAVRVEERSVERDRVLHHGR